MPLLLQSVWLGMDGKFTTLPVPVQHLLRARQYCRNWGESNNIYYVTALLLLQFLSLGGTKKLSFSLAFLTFPTLLGIEDTFAK